MDAVCALAAVVSLVWKPAPIAHPPARVIDQAWPTIAAPCRAPSLDVAARATPPRLETGGLALTLPREAVALRRAAQALGYAMPDPEAAAPPTSAQMLVDPQTTEFRTGTRVCVRYVARF